MGMFDRETESKQRVADLLERDGVVVVSEGTLRPEDLITKFEWWLDYKPGPCTGSLVPSPDVYLDLLTGEMERLAPEGFYFGTQEGDGACFGFFPQPEDE